MYKNKKILIMGLGVHGGGVAAAKYFAKQGAIVTVTDLKPKEELLDSIKLLKDYDIEYVLGGHRDEDFINADLIIRNPGVPKESKYLKLAVNNGIEIQMQEGIFFQLCPTQNIIGVTGTKGKTTTAYLIYEALKANDLIVHLAGNMKIPLLDTLDFIQKEDWVVLELSSWQCEALDDNKVSPKIGIITNIYPDHLNRYPSYKDYAMSKASIFKYPPNEEFITLKSNEFLKDYIKIAKNNVYLVDESTGVLKKNNRKVAVFDNNGLRGSMIRGNHNKTNMLLALAVSKIIDLNYKKTLNALKSFKGVPYRQELLGKVGDVCFINDTAATAPAGAIEAINTFKADNPVFIFGGADKNLDYTDLVFRIKKTGIDYVLLKGNATDKMLSAGLNGKVYDDFESAVREAFIKAKKKKGMVVLSPGCASFGMFKHEFDRGDQFNNIYKKIKAEYENTNK